MSNKKSITHVENISIELNKLLNNLKEEMINNENENNENNKNKLKKHLITGKDHFNNIFIKLQEIQTNYFPVSGMMSFSKIKSCKNNNKCNNITKGNIYADFIKILDEVDEIYNYLHQLKNYLKMNNNVRFDNVRFDSVSILARNIKKEIAKKLNKKKVI